MLRCHRCGVTFERVMPTPSSLMEQGVSLGRLFFGKGLLGDLLGIGGGIANVAVRASTGVGWNARCDCGSDEVEVLSETYTHVDYKHVERLYVAAVRRSHRHGPRAIEEAWATSYEKAHLPSESHRMPFVEPRGETLATHARVAANLYDRIAPERRAAFEARPDLDWIGIIRTRHFYLKMPARIRPAILDECRQYSLGEIPLEEATFVRDLLPSREAVAVLVEDLEALDERGAR